MFLSCPIIVFINDDFPALGLPTTANEGTSSTWSKSSFSKSLTNSSKRSPVPLPFIAEILKTLSNPNEKNSRESFTIVVLSTLLTAIITFLSVLCNNLFIS